MDINWKYQGLPQNIGRPNFLWYTILGNHFQNLCQDYMHMTMVDPGTYPGNHQGVISNPKHKIFGKMTPSCILQDFLYLFESKEIFQKFHS